MNTRHAEYTEDRLKSLRRVKDRAGLWGEALSLGCGALGILCVLAAADYRLALPTGARACGLALLVSFLGIGLARLVWRLRRPSTAKDIALEVERRRPELGCIVSTAVEYLPGGRTAKEVYEPELVAALQEQAARKLVVTETPWWRRQLVLRGYVAGGVAMLVGLGLVLVPGGTTAVQRALCPWSQAAYTSIEVKPGNIEVVEGTDQEIEASVAGKWLREARLEWQLTNAAPWQYAAMRRVASRRFVAPLLGVRGEISYRVTGREARSPQFKLDVVCSP